MRTIVIFALALLAGSAGAADPLAGRWRGSASIPGRELALTVDLEQDAKGAWRGSLICPGLVLSDAPLANIEHAGASVTFEIAALGAPGGKSPASFRGAIDKSGQLRGELTQAGNRARMVLSRSGAAQVVLPPGPTAVGEAFAGKWSGEFELGGYPRHVTLTLANAEGGGSATAALTIVGKRTTEVAVDLVRQERDRVRIESSTMGIALEAASRDARTLEGTFELGPLEIPLRLSRTE